MRTDLHSTLTNPGLAAVAEWIAVIILVFCLVVFGCAIWTARHRR